MKKLNYKGWKFVGLTFLLSTIPYYFILSEGSMESNWVLVLMWMPALAGVIMRLIKGEGLFKDLNWNPLKAWKLILAAAFIPLAIELFSLMAILGLNGAELKADYLVFEEGKVSVGGTALLFGAGLQPWYVFIPNYLLSYFTGVLFYSLLFAFGEEYGWRGYLQQQWAPENSRIAGFLSIGLIWGLWHLPGIMLGHNFPEYRILGAMVLMPLICIAFSFAFGMPFNKKKVIWLPAVFHGAVNISGEISGIALVAESIVNPLYYFIWIGLWLLIATLIFIRFRKLSSSIVYKSLPKELA